MCLCTGIIHLCKAGNSGIQSLIGLLCIPNMEVRVSCKQTEKTVIFCIITVGFYKMCKIAICQ